LISFPSSYLFVATADKQFDSFPTSLDNFQLDPQRWSARPLVSIVELQIVLSTWLGTANAESMTFQFSNRSVRRLRRSEFFLNIDVFFGGLPPTWQQEFGTWDNHFL
jgi:hypothetical protein